MIITGRLAAGRELSVTDFADLTDVEVTSVDWGTDGLLGVTFAEDLDDDTAQKVRRRITSETSGEERIQDQAAVNAAAIAAWAPTSQTVATLTAQVDRLSKQVIALSRLALRDND